VCVDGADGAVVVAPRDQPAVGAEREEGLTWHDRSESRLGAGRAGAERPAEAPSSDEVPDEHRRARAGRVEGPAVACDLGREDAPRLTGQRLAGTCPPHVPEDHAAVRARGDERAAIGREAGAEDLRAVAAQCLAFLPGCEVDEPHGAVVAADRHCAVARSKRREPQLRGAAGADRPALHGTQASCVAHHGLTLPDGHEAAPVAREHQRRGTGTVDGNRTG
jgi:hypothetical protein